MNVHVEKKETLPILAGKKLSQLLFLKKDISILLLLSGGSSLELLECADPFFCGSNVTISVIDERVNQEESNFNKLSKTSFFKNSLLSGSSYIHPVNTKDDTPDSVANRFGEAILSWMKRNPSGVIIATLGMGDDGHIAGIMPFPESKSRFDELFDNEHTYIRGYDAGAKSKFPLRVTSTLSLLRRITHAVVYISGEAKKPALEHVLKKDVSLSEMPAVILHDLSSVDLYTDISNLPVIE